VFGDDYDTPDGTGLRDYIHVVDLAEGHVTALEQAQPGYVVYNLGTGQPVSVLELIASFEKAAGHELPKQILDRRPAMCRDLLRPVQGERELGWKARLTIDDSCRDYWNWQSRNPDGYQTA
jgi:UDP-glucose 4-epimerase